MTSSVRCGPLGVIRYTSLRDENRSMSAMPRKRRRAVKASSVAMGQQRTPAVHTGREKLLNPRSDPRVGFEVQIYQELCGLTDSPEERQRPLDDAAYVAAPRLMAQPEAERHPDYVFESRFVDAAGCSFFFVQRSCLEPSRDLGLDLRTGRPARIPLIADGSNPL